MEAHAKHAQSGARSLASTIIDRRRAEPDWSISSVGLTDDRRASRRDPSRNVEPRILPNAIT
jgi:hypothetical protein